MNTISQPLINFIDFAPSTTEYVLCMSTISDRKKVIKKAIRNRITASSNPPIPSSGQAPSIVPYDYLEHIVASIVFSYSAIEAFANEEIPDEFKYEVQNESGVYVSYT